MRRLGDGVDWGREALHHGRRSMSRAVRTIFKRLYDAGLIYQAERLVNWSPVAGDGRSRISRSAYEDRRRRTGVVSATARLTSPEAAHRGGHHPDGDDAGRHRDRGASRRRNATESWSAPRLPHPFLDRQLVVVADDHVDPEFGNRAQVKVTPRPRSE